MQRRRFLQRAGLTGAALLSGMPCVTRGDVPKRGRDTWLFFDLWHVSRMHNIELRQGEPVWRPEGTYTDSLGLGLAGWCTVEPPGEHTGGKWRMFYSADWKPFTLCLAESDDGIRWQRADHADVKPEGEKEGPHHVYTIPDGSAGGVYIDPVAADGFRYKVYAHQQGEPVYERALKDPQHPWHDAAKELGEAKVWMMDEMTGVSRDGVHWQTRYDYRWGARDWHPEPPLFGFHHAETGRHVMTTRPGWGDRRVVTQWSNDFKQWSGPSMLFHPADALDGELVEHYAMPVVRYEGHYVGLVWMFHPQMSEPTNSFNRYVGKMDCQLAYSYDGVHFSRGRREPFIGVTPPGEHGCAGVSPSSVAMVDDEIRIYSASSKHQHGTWRHFKEIDPAERGGIILHTLRKDGFMYVTPKGGVGELTSKPLVLFDDDVTLNVEAPFGEVRVGFVDWRNRPIEGFAVEDGVPLKRGDDTAWRVRFKNDRALKDLAGKPVRIVVQMRDARLYAVRGDLHWLDAHDTQMLRDGRPIDARVFDH